MHERTVIVDAGPLVALLNRADAYHRWAMTQFAAIPAPLATCEPVLTETFHLLRRIPDGSNRFFELLGRCLLTVDFSLLQEASAISNLVKRYRSIPMSLADACLVRMSEIIPDSVVLTLDADFRIYRKHRRQMVPTIMPPDR